MQQHANLTRRFGRSPVILTVILDARYLVAALGSTTFSHDHLQANQVHGGSGALPLIGYRMICSLVTFLMVEPFKK